MEGDDRGRGAADPAEQHPSERPRAPRSADAWAQEAAERAALLEAVDDTILVVDDALTVHEVNHLAAFIDDPDAAELHVADLVGRSLGTLLFEEDVQKVRAAVLRTLQTEQQTALRARGKRPEQVVIVRVAPYPATEAGARRALIIARDNTQWARAEAQVWRVEQQLRFIAANGNIDLWDIVRRRDDDVSSLTARIGSIVGSLSTQSREALAEAVAGLDAARSETFALELELVGDDGATRYLATSARVAERDKQGRWQQLVGTSVDITDQRRAHAEQLALRAQLQHAQKLDAVGKLAGGVAHDFNNLLQVIIGHLTLASDDQKPGSPAAEELELAQQAASRAAQLTRQLLTYARRQPTEPQVLSLGAQVTSSLSMLKRILPESVIVRAPAERATACVEADAGQLSQVLMNLCVNARDAMPDGGVLTIEADTVDLDADDPNVGAAGPGTYVVLRVLDTGVGLSAEALEHADEPFFTTKRTGEGAGLGLAIVTSIVHQHSGTLRLKNRPNGGAQIEVLLPLADPSAVAAERADARGAARAGTVHRRVLLAEDEETVRNVLTRTLTRAGFEVLVATNGPEAVAIARAADPPVDIAVIDAVMPGMSGREVCEALLEHRPRMPLVLASGYSDSVLGPTFLDDHDIEVVSKPFEGRVLVEAMMRALNRAPAG